jgi:hypothetical protein
MAIAIPSIMLAITFLGQGSNSFIQFIVSLIVAISSLVLFIITEN